MDVPSRGTPARGASEATQASELEAEPSLEAADEGVLEATVAGPEAGPGAPVPGPVRRLARASVLRSVGEVLPYSTVDRRVAQLGHGFGLDLADALTGEVEVLTHLLEGAGLASVEPEA
jgi:hypothetical protein